MKPDVAPEAPTTVTRHVVVAISLVGLAVVLWRTSDAFVIAFGGVVLAALLRGMARPVCHWTGIRERWCVLIVVAMSLLIVVGVAWLFGQQATKEATELRDQLPAAVHKALDAVQRTDTGKAIVATVRGGATGEKAAANVGIAATALMFGLLDVILILFLGIYFALDAPLYRDGGLRLLPPRHRQRVGRVLEDAGEALQKWLLGQAIAMVTVGVLVGVGLAVVGVPLALALGALAALLEFVPVVGPILFSIPGLLLAFAKGPETALYAFFVYLVVQQFEGNVLIPLIQRWAVELPPVVGLLAVVIGGLLLGVPGVIFATPLAVVIMRIVKHLYVEDTLESASPAGKLPSRGRRGMSRAPSSSLPRGT